VATVDLPDVLTVEDVETERDDDGRASVYFGEKAKCECVMRILRDIGLRAEAEAT